MKKTLAKALLCILMAAAITFAGLFGALIAAFMGGALFYAPLILVCAAGAILFVFLKAFAPIKPKLFSLLALSFIGLCVLSSAGYELYRVYQNSFAQVNDQGVDLSDYKPFAQDTKAVKLEVESSLKLEGDLPRLDGATALYPLYAAFAQATYPAADYPIYAFKEQAVPGGGEVACSTTPDAYSRLLRGETDIIFVAGPSEQQLEEARRMGLELKLTPIGKEAFVFFVNARNGVSGLSTAQIQAIYAGEITNWREVGGKNEKIRAFQRPENSGSQTALQKLMAGKTLMTPPKEDVISGMGGIIEQTASYRNYKNAMGYSFLFFATEMIRNNEIKLLAVDGVAPGRETIASGAYPLTSDFYAVTAAGDNPNIERFLEWICSEQGQYLVEKTGYTPVG